MHSSMSVSPGRGGSTPSKRGRSRPISRENGGHKIPSDYARPETTYTTCLDIPVEGAIPIPQATAKGTTEALLAISKPLVGSTPAQRAPRGAKTSALAALQTRSPSPDNVEPSASRIVHSPPVPLPAPRRLDLTSVKTTAPRNVSPPAEPRPFDLEDCPVFYPTEEEFRDPMRYVHSVGEEAKQYGICKIVPPVGWKMPFITDTDTFRFKTRLQRLNSIEASSRAKINFLEQLYRFHKQQGNSRITVPTINHQPLDLWLLRKEVLKLGGFETVSRTRQWGDLARSLGYHNPTATSQLKAAYSRIILPYENFSQRVRNSSSLSPSTPRTGTPNILQRSTSPTPSRMKRMNVSLTTSDVPSAATTATTSAPSSPLSTSSSPLSEPPDDADLKSGIRVEMAHPSDMDIDLDSTTSIKVDSARLRSRARTSGIGKKRASSDLEGGDGETCEVCKDRERGTEMLLCDGCDLGYHMFCLDPPLTAIPRGQWFCHNCLFGTGQDFGFDEGEEHSLSSFQQRDLAFRKMWFASHPPKPSLSTEHCTTNTIGGLKVSEYDIENEFWRLVGSPYETVEVEYGADVHSTTHGSAMPTMETHPRNIYSRDPWNLNNLPIISESLLRFIKSDISGMTVPWTYVGMVFSTFCWHNEDHYTSSINFMHWGETKTWYGIPAEDAEKFEAAIKSEAPDLFEAQPDLLFQLVTLMNPGRLRQAGVRVVACNQRAGEFVITFPKAYHAGFNHGLNFNEAVNFALPDWLPHGRACVERYQVHGKLPVFSHDELLITITQYSQTIKTAIWLHPHLQEMTEREINKRQALRAQVPNLVERLDERDHFEDQYQCYICKVFCYLSQVTCQCTKQVACLDHAASLCGCAITNRGLRKRFSDDQLHEILAKVVERANLPASWREKLHRVLLESPRPSLRILRALVAEGDRINFASPELSNLKKCVIRANDWVDEANKYTKRKESSRKRTKKALKARVSTGPSDTADEQPPDRPERTLEEVEQLLADVEMLGFEAPEVAILSGVLSQAKDFRSKAAKLVAEMVAKESAENVLDNPQSRAACLEKCETLLAQGSSFNIHINDLVELEKLVKKYVLLDELDEVDDNSITLGQVRSLLDRARDCGLPLTHKSTLILQDRQNVGEQWETRARTLLNQKQKSLKELEYFANMPDNAPIDPTLLNRLTSLRTRGKEIERQARLLLFPELGKRAKISDAFRLINRAEKDYQMHSISELKRICQFAADLESRCELVLTNRHQQADDGLSVFDMIRKWRTYAREHLTMFELPTFDALDEQLSLHDDWLEGFPWMGPAEGERVIRDVMEMTSIDDAAPNDEYCTCICLVPVRPPPPGTVSEAVQCDHCHARFHPLCAGGSCPFCDHHHWNGSIHNGRMWHFAVLRNLYASAPELTKNYEPAYLQLEQIVNRVQRLSQNIAAFLHYASQPGNQRAELIPQVRHFMRKLFKIQFPVSSNAEASFGLDLAGLHRILATQPRARNSKKRKRPKFTFAQDLLKVTAIDSRCLCAGHPNAAPPNLSLGNVRCMECEKTYHVACVNYTVGAAEFTCPMCATRKGKRYHWAEVRVKWFEDQDPNIFVDTRQMLEHYSKELIRVVLPPKSGPVLILHLVRFTPGITDSPPDLVTTIHQSPATMRLSDPLSATIGRIQTPTTNGYSHLAGAPYPLNVTSSSTRSPLTYVRGSKKRKTPEEDPTSPASDQPATTPPGVSGQAALDRKRLKGETPSASTTSPTPRSRASGAHAADATRDESPWNHTSPAAKEISTELRAEPFPSSIRSTSSTPVSVQVPLSALGAVRAIAAAKVDSTDVNSPPRAKPPRVKLLVRNESSPDSVIVTVSRG